MAPLASPERRDLLEVLDDPPGRALTLTTRQVPVESEHDLIGEPTHADAICNRLSHTAYLIEHQGPPLLETRTRAWPGGSSGGAPEPVVGCPQVR